MNAPRVSVVLPTYNRAPTLERAVRSVLDQDERDLELIVVDSGSTDGTGVLLDRLTREDPRVRVVGTGKDGAAAARNAGVRRAKARILAFQDSDDEWRPGSLSKKLAALEAWPDAVAAYSFIERHQPDGTARLMPAADSPRLQGDLSKALLERNLVSTQSLVVHASALRKAGAFDESLPQLEDWELALRLARIGPFAFVAEPLVVAPYQRDSLSLDKAAYLRALEAVVQRHRAELEEEPMLMAWHADRIGLGHVLAGRMPEGRRWSRLAWMRDPSRWPAAARSLAPGWLARRLQRVAPP